jgi:adenylate cyclase
MRRSLASLPLPVVAAAVAAVAIVAFLTNVAREPELRTVDVRFEVRGARASPRNVVVVQIDSASLERLAQPTFPFPRRLHAKAIDRISAGRPRVIAYDVAFIGLTHLPDDEALALAAERAGKVVFVTDRVDSRGRTNLLGGDALLQAIHVRPAHAGAPPDPGAVIRRLVGAVDGLKTLPVVGAEVASGARRRVAGEPYVDFAGPAGTVRTFSFGDVVLGRVPASAFTDRAVVVGPGRELETHPTSVGDMSGAEIQANALATVLNGTALHDLPSVFAALLVAVLGFGMTLLAGRLPARAAASLAVGVLALLAVGAQGLFQAGTVVPVVVPAMSVAIGTGAGAAWGSAARRLGRLHRRFSQYAPAMVVDQPLTGARDAPAPGVLIDATVLFADLRGFTSHSESRPPEEVVHTLNRYFGEMSAAITDHGGVVLDYMGDGIMAAFGVPEPAPDDADRALAAAREMLGPRLKKVNTWLDDQRIDERFAMGIGLNSGEVLAGSIGSDQRLVYTAIGDTTNTAARLEAMTKELKRTLVIADTTRERMSPDVAASLELLADVSIRGRSASVTVWSLPAPPVSPTSPGGESGASSA